MEPDRQVHLASEVDVGKMWCLQKETEAVVLVAGDSFAGVVG